MPEQVRQHLKSFYDGLVSRFRPIWRALVLMWRAGPALIGGYVLLFALILVMQQVIALATTRLIGPHDLYSFWMVADTLVFLLIPFVIEPLRIVLVAGAYNTTLQHLDEATESPASSDAAARPVERTGSVTSPA